MSYEVEHLLKRRESTYGSCEYRVRWKGFSPLDDTWECVENIRDGSEESMQYLDAAYQRYEQGEAEDWKKNPNYKPFKILSDDVINNQLVFLTSFKDKDEASQEFVSAAHMYRHWSAVAQTYWDRLYNETMMKMSASRTKYEKGKLKQLQTGDEAKSDSMKKSSRSARKRC